MAYDEKKAQELAEKIITNSKNTLIVKLRFLDAALCALKPVPEEGGSSSTEGAYYHYNPRHIIVTYKEEPNAVLRDYLHTVLHLVFHHAFIGPAVNPERWNLACDVAVENIISSLNIKALYAKREDEQQKLKEILKGGTDLLSAEKIYRILTQYDLSKRQLSELRNAFFADDHDLWYLPPENEDNEKGKSGDDGDSDAGEDESSGGGKDSQEKSSGGGRDVNKDKLSDMWSEISRRAQVDLETTSKEWGDKTDDLMRSLGILNREKYDYADFLSRFTSEGEAIKTSADEFDYIFYTYGLKLYKNMPLIEPLEYSNVKKIRDFAIVIDVSGSVEGEKVERFMTKTYNIMAQQENFFSKINVHIITADAEVKSDVKITSADEFNEYIKTAKLCGFGGTDFRAAFNYVDALIQKGEFTDFKGLIYFTDGEGIYPEKMPAYKAAFVFIDKDIPPSVPVWAIKIVLDDEDLC